jgi:hypothetical protein
MLRQLFSSSGAAAVVPIRAALDRAAAARAAELKYDAVRPAHIAIAIDQIERLFTESTPDAAQAFARIIKALVEEKLAYVICALRSDAYPQFQLLSDLMNLKGSGASFDLLPPSKSELEEIVSRPVEACQPPLTFESKQGRSLAEVIVEDTKGGDALPLLQMTLGRLFEAEGARNDGILRFSDYPGIDEAVSRAAANAMKGLDQHATNEVAALVTALVRDVAVDPITGEQVPVIAPIDRDAFEADHEARAALVEAFVAARLLTAESIEGAIRVRPVHDALLRTWPEAVRITTENASLIRVRHTLEPIVREWRTAKPNMKGDYLELPSALLAGAESLSSRLPDSLSEDMRSFIREAIAAETRRREREREDQERRIKDAEALAEARRRTTRLSLLGLAVAIGLALTAGWQWYQAVRARQQALFELYLQERATSDSANISIENAKLLKGILSFAQALRQRVDRAVKQGDASGALTLARMAQPILKQLQEAKPDNIDLLEEIASNEQQIGDACVALGDLPGAIASYKNNVALRKVLVERDPGNVERQLLKVIALFKLATTGSEPVANLNEALMILRSLDTAGNLPANNKNWINQIEKVLADVLKSR